MPRIPDHILQCSVYLYTTEEKARSGAPVDGGSGFLLSYPTNRSDLRPRPHIYVVTSKHVIEDTPAHSASDGQDHPGAKVVRFHSAGGENPILSLNDEWYSAEDADVAIKLLDPNRRPRPHMAFKAISAELLVTQDLRERLNLGIGDEVFMVGRLLRQDIEEVNCPIVRFGHIACPLVPLQVDELGEEVFLAEYRSLGKASGSPVFLEISERQREFYKDQLGGREHLLLGINRGSMRYRSPAQRVDCQTLKGPVTFSVPIDSSISRVVPAWKLQDLLKREDVRAERQAIEDAIQPPPVWSPDTP